MRGLCPIIVDMARTINSASNDKEAMEKITQIDKKATYLRKIEMRKDTFEGR